MARGKKRSKSNQESNFDMANNKIDNILDGGQKIGSDWFDGAVKKDFGRITIKRDQKESDGSDKYFEKEGKKKS